MPDPTKTHAVGDTLKVPFVDEVQVEEQAKVRMRLQTWMEESRQQKNASKEDLYTRVWAFIRQEAPRVTPVGYIDDLAGAVTAELLDIKVRARGE